MSELAIFGKKEKSVLSDAKHKGRGMEKVKHGGLLDTCFPMVVERTGDCKAGGKICMDFYQSQFQFFLIP